jgi:hypothetical protein
MLNMPGRKAKYNSEELIRNVYNYFKLEEKAGCLRVGLDRPTERCLQALNITKSQLQYVTQRKDPSLQAVREVVEVVFNSFY